MNGCKDPFVQYRLTEICQVIANANSRRMLEMLAAAPMTFDDLKERVDLQPNQLECATRMMMRLGLVKAYPSSRSRPTTYALADSGGGLLLLRDWMDRIAAIAGGERYSN